MADDRHWIPSEPVPGSSTGPIRNADAPEMRELDSMPMEDFANTEHRGWRMGHGLDRAPRLNHTGKGPKGYRRSDERIREEICEWLTADPRIDASTIEVKVVDGIVVLTGTMRDRSQKRLAENVVDSVRGVRDVFNHIVVHQDSFEIVREMFGLGKPD